MHNFIRMLLPLLYFLRHGRLLFSDEIPQFKDKYKIFICEKLDPMFNNSKFNKRYLAIQFYYKMWFN